MHKYNILILFLNPSSLDCRLTSLLILVPSTNDLIGSSLLSAPLRADRGARTGDKDPVLYLHSKQFLTAIVNTANIRYRPLVTGDRKKI